MAQFKSKLIQYDQQHLLKFWEELSDNEKLTLEHDVGELNFTELSLYIEKVLSSCSDKGDSLDFKVQPIPETIIATVNKSSKERLEIYENEGLLEIANGRVAVLLMAGGQGTRLGVAYPKGMIDVGLPSRKTLFQLQAERILRLQTLAEVKFVKKGKIIWYILTSEATHKDTVSYLQRNKYFGLSEENVKAFKQGMVPCFDFQGKILLDEKYAISKAPDGNGGVYRALKSEGILDDMRKRGIRSVHAHSVDNILIKVADPIFIGYCLLSNVDCGVKVVEKSSPSEQVGVVCKVEDEYRVVEYSEISKKTAELRDEKGHLVYNAANICNHYFTVDFLSTIADVHATELEIHLAKKKIPFIDNIGKKCNPTKSNGVKIEKFIFDVFKFSKNFAVWGSVRDSEFSPVKNSNSAGKDCPSTARADLLKLHKTWLLNAEVNSVEGDVEVSPLISYAGENLSQFAHRDLIQGPISIDL
ncbi:UDP-N-acetylhexosamine pyrophosphorylase [Prorops nasuta]|uniref:UDP-N-acetylhexosamine pyrophosphorylase n=1 Tax=Prorops nasuta TaxID=863751 RepID=UPI0034CF25B6